MLTGRNALPPAEGILHIQLCRPEAEGLVSVECY